jgi:hypothetical protein
MEIPGNGAGVWFPGVGRRRAVSAEISNKYAECPLVENERLVYFFTSAEKRGQPR